MADPLLSCSDLPVCYGDWEVSGGHIAGESHGLRHSPRALCVVDPGNIIPGSLLRNYPAVSRAYWRLPPAPPAVTARGHPCWRPAGEGRAGTTAPKRLRPPRYDARHGALPRTAHLSDALGPPKLPASALTLQGIRLLSALQNSCCRPRLLRDPLTTGYFLGRLRGLSNQVEYP